MINRALFHLFHTPHPHHSWTWFFLNGRQTPMYQNVQFVAQSSISGTENIIVENVGELFVHRVPRIESRFLDSTLFVRPSLLTLPTLHQCLPPNLHRLSISQMMLLFHHLHPELILLLVVARKFDFAIHVCRTRTRTPLATIRCDHTATDPPIPSHLR